MVKLTQFCNFNRVLGTINIFKNCSSGIRGWICFLHVFYKKTCNCPTKSFLFRNVKPVNDQLLIVIFNVSESVMALLLLGQYHNLSEITRAVSIENANTTVA